MGQAWGWGSGSLGTFLGYLLELPGAARGYQELPGATKSQQETPQAARIHQEIMFLRGLRVLFQHKSMATQLDR